MRRALLIIFLVVTLGPPTALIVQGVVSLATNDRPPEATLGARHWQLLATTVWLALCVSAAATVIATPAAMVLGRTRRGPLIWLRRLALATIIVPPYVHALAWQTTAARLAAALSNLGFSMPVPAGWPMAWWVDTMAYLPLAFGLALVGLASVDPDHLDAARVGRRDAAALWRVVLPLAGPQILAASGLVFVLALTDYGVPSLFQVSTYPLEVYVHFSRGGPPLGTLLQSLPLMAAAIVAIVLSQSGLRAAVTRPLRPAGVTATPLILPPWLRAVTGGAVAILAAQVIVPIVSLITGVGSCDNLAGAVGEAREELLTTLVVALVAAAVCLPLAAAVGHRLAESRRGGRFWWIVTMLPIAVPAPLVGIGLVVMWNRPLVGGVYGTLAMPILAVLARFAPLGCLVAAAQFRRVDPLLSDAARVFEPRTLHRWLRAALPTVAPGLLAAACVVAALAAAELPATLIVAPPGQATLTMRIYNYLHYGASEAVAGLCLVATVSALLVAGLMSAVLRRWWFATGLAEEGRG